MMILGAGCAAGRVCGSGGEERLFGGGAWAVVFCDCVWSFCDAVWRVEFRNLISRAFAPSILGSPLSGPPFASLSRKICASAHRRTHRTLGSRLL